MINTNQKAIKKTTTLYDFAKLEIQNNNVSIKKSESGKQNKSSQSFGLSTLLHFNHNDTISSIRSKPIYNDSNMLSSKYSKFAGQAKNDIEQLRAKRLQLQKKWKKQICNHLEESRQKQSRTFNENDHKQSVLDASDVQQYYWNQDKPVYPRNRLNIACEDKLVIDLRRQILADKLIQLEKCVKKIMFSRVCSQLKKYIVILNFKQNSEQNLMHTIFQEWREICQRSSEREHLRKVIIQKIKRRRHLNELNSQIQLSTIKL